MAKFYVISDSDDEINDTKHNTTSSVKVCSIFQNHINLIKTESIKIWFKLIVSQTLDGKTVITNETIISRKTKTGDIVWTIRAVETRFNEPSLKLPTTMEPYVERTEENDATEFVQFTSVANLPKDVEYYSSEEFDPSHRQQDFFEDIDGIEVGTDKLLFNVSRITMKNMSECYQYISISEDQLNLTKKYENENNKLYIYITHTCCKFEILNIYV